MISLLLVVGLGPGFGALGLADPGSLNRGGGTERRSTAHWAASSRT